MKIRTARAYENKINLLIYGAVIISLNRVEKGWDTTHTSLGRKSTETPRRHGMKDKRRNVE